jgi:poly(A) polymerase
METAKADAVAIVRRLRDAGHTAYFAGGCVRDMLLGHEPQDYDVATDAEPSKVRSLFSRTQAVGAAFGVILVRHSASVCEVATFRTDGPYSDGRRPDAVRFATASEDAQRRDFTINGLFLDPLNDEVIDFVGGREDLKNRRLRAIGEAAKRFEEDHLRLLRAVRFAARFDFEIEAQTAAAVRHASPRLKEISPERIADELRGMLTPITRKRAWPLLWELGLADVIFRLLPGFPPTSAQRLDIFLAVCPQETIPFGLALAAAAIEATATADLRAPFEKGQVRRLTAAMRKTLRISNEEFDAMAETLAGLSPLLQEAEPRLAIKKRFLAEPTAGMSRRLLSALGQRGFFTQRVAALESELAELEKTDFAPPPLLNGDDLTAAGLKPGPEFKRLLDSVYDAQLEGKVQTQRQALDMVINASRH